MWRDIISTVGGSFQYCGACSVRTVELLEVSLHSTEWCPSTVLMVSAHSAKNPPCIDGNPHSVLAIEEHLLHYQLPQVAPPACTSPKQAHT